MWNFLEGPISLTYLKGKKKEIILFGDMHRFIADCRETELSLTTEQFILFNTIINPNKSYSLFLE